MPLPPLPPLPPPWMAHIFGGQTQQINGPDVDSPQMPSTDRLVFIGYTVIQLGIMTWLNERYPKYQYANLTAKLTKLMAKRPASWARLYKLPSHFPISTIQNQPESTLLSKGNLFSAYVGSIYSDTDGSIATNEFIKAILDFEEEEGSAESDGEDESLAKIHPRNLAQGIFMGGGTPGSPMKNDLGQRPTPPSPQSPTDSGQNALSLFNELATKKRVQALWDDECSGPDHLRIWDATLTVGEGKFRGTGNSKRQARLSAADLALKALNWGSK